MSLPGGKQCKETLLRKASESAAHVAGFGLHLEGYGPPNHPKRFFDSLSLPQREAFYVESTWEAWTAGKAMHWRRRRLGT